MRFTVSRSVRRESNTLAVPTHAELQMGNRTRPAFLFQVDDTPLQRKLGFYEVLG